MTAEDGFANTTEHASAFSRLVFVRAIQSNCPSRKRRAQGRPGAGRTRKAGVQAVVRNRRTPVYRFGRNDRPSLRDGVTAYTCSPRRAGLVGRRHPQSLTSLIPASGDQDHTISPSAPMRIALAHPSVHRIPVPTFVAIARNAPPVDQDGSRIITDSISDKENYFQSRGLTRLPINRKVICPTGGASKGVRAEIEPARAHHLL
jgi:hypothetical protein